MLELLKTKLFIPRPRSNLVSRPRLTERLNAGPDRKLTLIAAPAGFGKTTALSEWIPQSPHCVTWLSLDRSDNDPTLFWAYFIASVQQIHPELGSAALTLLRSPQPPPIHSILTSLLNEIASFPDSFCTVLDDYHVIEEQSIHEGLAYLVDHLPGNYHLVITTRVDPPLPLARLRARDELTELRANDLRFTAEEAEKFLVGVTGLNLTGEEVAMLGERAEGWVAGLQIAALSMQDQEDLSGFVRTFSGSHRHILGYLAEEVLEQRPEGTMQFLLQTSILDRLCGPLCNAVTGETDGQAMLEKLDQAHLFISPLDDESKWFRYHHLFAEVLQAKLRRNQPGIPAVLHRRASEWYEQNGFVMEALDHAYKAGEFESAARMIEGAAPGWLELGTVRTLRDWIDALPEETMRSHPRLNMAYAYVLAYSGDPAGFKERLSMIEQMLRMPDDLSEEERKDLLGEVAAMKARAAFDRNEKPDLDELRAILSTISPGNTRVRGLLAYAIGTEEQLRGNMAEAANYFAQAADWARERGDQTQAVYAMGFVADLQEVQGLLRQAARTYTDALQMARSPNGEPLPIGATANIGLGRIFLEWNDLEKSEDYLHQGMKLGRLSGVESVELHCALTMAFVLQARGDPMGADAIIQRAADIAKRWNLQPTIIHVAAAEVRLNLLRGQKQTAAQLAQSYSLFDLSDLDRPLELEHCTLARLLVAQNKLGEAMQFINHSLARAERDGRGLHVVEMLALLALVDKIQGNADDAFETLGRALLAGEMEGYKRSFIDHGEPMHTLLLDYRPIARQRTSRSRKAVLPEIVAYVDELLAGFSRPVQRGSPESGVISEPLTEREQEILLLLSKGLSNQEIADLLVVAVSTVKSHINNLYSKLGTHRRAQAIAIARQRGLIPS